MSIPNNTVGYAAIFLPEQGDYQGFYVSKKPDNPEPLLMALLALAAGVHPEGALQATMVEGMVSGRQDILAAAATAYADLTGKRFFYIIAAIDEKGTDTKAIDLAATSISAARDEINALPMARSMRAKKGMNDHG